MEHELKTWPAFFDAIARGEKTFEVRKNDRSFRVGDTLRLRRFNPTTGFLDHYDGQEVRAEVLYVMHGGAFGLAQGWVCMGIKVLEMAEVDPEGSATDA